MKKGHKQPGYILIFSFIIMSLIVMLATRISDIGISHVRYVRTMIEKEQARRLAWNGVNIAMSQLAMTFDTEKKQQSADVVLAPGGEKEKQPAQQEVVNGWKAAEAKLFLEKILPLIHRWQIFEFSTKEQGIDGQVKIYISGENGKVNIDDMFDFQERKFKGIIPKWEKGSQPQTSAMPDKKQKSKDFGMFLEPLFKGMGKFIKGKDLFKELEKYLTKEKQFEKLFKNRNRLIDTTEFFNIKAFNVFEGHVYPRPLKKGEKKDKNIFWTNIFTTAFSYLWGQINPWFLTQSLQNIFGFKSKENILTKKNKLEGFLKNFKLKMSWPDDWDKLFAELYGIKYANLPKWVQPVMSKEFACDAFSVVSYGTVGDVTQKLYAIVSVSVVREKKKGKDRKKQEEVFIKCYISRSYWV